MLNRLLLLDLPQSIATDVLTRWLDIPSSARAADPSEISATPRLAKVFCSLRADTRWEGLDEERQLEIDYLDLRPEKSG